MRVFKINEDLRIDVYEKHLDLEIDYRDSGPVYSTRLTSTEAAKLRDVLNEFLRSKEICVERQP